MKRKKLLKVVLANIYPLIVFFVITYNNMKIWKSVPFNLDYEVSNVGEVRSLKFGKKKILKLDTDKDGYYQINLCKNNRIIKKKIHRLVMLIFVGESDLQVNHKNGIKSDNRIENLEYCTNKENQLHRYRILGNKGRIKKVNQYTKEGNFIKTWDSIIDADRNLNIAHSSISAVCKGKLKTAGGYKWQHY